MRSKLDVDKVFSRRESFGILAALGGAMVGCGGASALTSDDAGTTADSGSTGDATPAADSGVAWATGGTASMTGNYVDPFPTSVPSCTLAHAVTEGPCTEAADQVRKDISEGYSGLPMRLALRVVDGSCNPIAGATVKVWHTQKNGSYSGNTPNPGMCLKDQADSAKHYFRGVQTTNATGRVDFDSCFPGWYKGRTVHVHYTVTANGKSFTSQLVFDQNLVNEIFTSHPEYSSYGLPDTTNSTDNVVGKETLALFLADTTKMADGAMMAAKLLVVSV